MAYTSIKQVIQANVYDNTNQEIGGNRLRDVLIAMVDAIVGEGFVLGGLANASTTFGTPEQRTFWIAQTSFTSETLGEVKGGDIILWDSETLTKESISFEKEVFIAEFGETTYLEISNAIASGSLVSLRIEDDTFANLVKTDEEYIEFVGIVGDKIAFYRVGTNNEWVDGFVTFENIVNKKGVLSDSTTEYPQMALLKSIRDELIEMIRNTSGFGTYLSDWNATTGLPGSNPPESPYEYKAGSWYLVGTVGSVNYKPSGTSYVTGVPSTEVETSELAVLDVYRYDGQGNWSLIHRPIPQQIWGNIAGTLSNQTDLWNALQAMESASNKENIITPTSTTKYPSSKAVADYAEEKLEWATDAEITNLVNSILD